MSVLAECVVCGGVLQGVGEEDFIRYCCVQCGIPYYVYASSRPRSVVMGGEREGPSVLVLLFPFVSVFVLELVYCLLLR